jgi:hypothetical protein
MRADLSPHSSNLLSFRKKLATIINWFQGSAFNWFQGRALEPMSRGSAWAAKMEAEPPDIHYQAEPGNE